MKNFFNHIIITVYITACTATPINSTDRTGTPYLITPTDTPKYSITSTTEFQTKCPVEDLTLVPNIQLPQDPIPPPNLEEPILDFLNSGGSPDILIRYLDRIGAAREENLFSRDLTGDGVPELVIGESHLRIYTCQKQKYYVAADLAPYTWATPSFIFVNDMNLDGLPEIVIHRLEDGVVDVVRDYQILEWDGQKFKNLIAPQNFENRYIGYSSIEEGWIVIGGVTRPHSNSQWAMDDIDKNGTLELILTGGISVNTEGLYKGPWRVTTTIYMWNGNNFVMHDAEYEPAQFRFEAVQDADYAAIKGQYDKALGLYQQVISDDTLDWWSEDMREYEMALAGTSNTMPTPTLPAPDTNERDNLAAYAYYRIVLLHVVRGNLLEAQTAYDSLQSNYPVNHTGHSYAELGKIFWTNYQSLQNIGTACNKAISFAEEHKTEILYYIGDWNRHNWQSFYYEPEDICPFK